MKQNLLRLFLKTLDQASLANVMSSSVARRGQALTALDAEVDLRQARRIFVAGVGKAARPMCEALLPLLPEDRTSSAVVAPTSLDRPLPGAREFVGGHPYPNRASDESARFLLDQVAGLGADDLFICLLSGGGSAICEAPLYPSVSLADMQAFYEVLVTCGANIVQINILRKHLSRIKGGRLGQAAYPATQMTLYVSDVPPDEPSSVASGPTMPDASTCEDAYRTAEELGIVARLPASIRRFFATRTLAETPKPGAAEFARSQWVCLLDNAAVLETLEGEVRRLGWEFERDLSVDDQPVELSADTLLDRLQRLSLAHPGKTVAVTTGGELSSPVKGDGRGGRNQAFVLWTARKLAERGMRATVLSAGTDGVDGNSPAAGAIADESTVPRARSLGLDPADFEQRSDSFGFFQKLDDLIMTGPTGNNVRDLRILVAAPQQAIRHS
ncbi:MAG: DUF4147 domain-containing protein [Bryobacterales bacterium]|nr:DUF4147 domain-containing protein [Bryobacterales bacterium]